MDVLIRSALECRKPSCLTIVAFRGISKLDINKVHFEFLCSLDTNKERRTTASSNDFIRVVRALEDESEASFLYPSN